MVHDFGGPIGLSSAIQNNERIKQIVLFNTWLWETKNNPDAMKVDKILHSRLGKFLYLQMNFSPSVLLKKGFDDQKKLTSQIHKQYKGPFPNKASRWSLLNLGKSLVGASDWYQEQWGQLDKIDQKPWLILWGTKDTFITMEYVQKWTQRIPDAKVVTFECGHFVQEEKMMEAIQELEKFMNSSNK